MAEPLTDAELAEIDRWHIDRFHQRAEVRDLGRPCRVCPLLTEVQRLRAREAAQLARAAADYASETPR